MLGMEQRPCYQLRTALPPHAVPQPWDTSKLGSAMIGKRFSSCIIFGLLHSRLLALAILGPIWTI